MCNRIAIDDLFAYIPPDWVFVDLGETEASIPEQTTDQAKMKLSVKSMVAGGFPWHATG